MEKIIVKNRKNQNLSVIIEKNSHQQGLVFVAHGLGDSKDSKHIEKFAKCFKDNDYSVVRFDATNTFGESDGIFENATLTNYYEDLEDVIEWSKKEDFFQEPYLLCGHSLGAICCALYAENNPEKVKALAPISTVVNFNLSSETYTKEDLEKWQKTGWLIEDWPDGEVKLKWSYMEDKKKYDLLDGVEKLTMPVLMIVGGLDDSTLPKHQKSLFDKIPGKKELHIISGAPHTFRTEKHLKEIYKIMDAWIKSLAD